MSTTPKHRASPLTTRLHTGCQFWSKSSLCWKGLEKLDIGEKREPFQLTVTTCDCRQRGTLPAAWHCRRASGTVGDYREADGGIIGKWLFGARPFRADSRNAGVFIDRSAVCKTDSMSGEEPKSALFVLGLGELYRHHSVSPAVRQFVTR